MWLLLPTEAQQEQESLCPACIHCVLNVIQYVGWNALQWVKGLVQAESSETKAGAFAKSADCDQNGSTPVASAVFPQSYL